MKEQWEKELEELEMELDGCKCYHESTKSFIRHLLEKEREEAK